MAGILDVTHDELVSSDFNGSHFSSVLDVSSSISVNNKFLNLIAWLVFLVLLLFYSILIVSHNYDYFQNKDFLYSFKMNKLLFTVMFLKTLYFIDRQKY